MAVAPATAPRRAAAVLPARLQAQLPGVVDGVAREGYAVVRGLLLPAEAAQLREHFMRVRATGPKPGDMGGDPARPEDPLNRFPRMINMHDWDEPTRAWAQSDTFRAVAGAAIGQEAVLCQTMLYFKPPGARGQAVHQDQQYITRTPLIGVWCALDDSDVANGCMVVVPGSHQAGLLPVAPADTAVSFTGGGSVLPPGSRIEPVVMRAGDALLFVGLTIHGSHPNTTTDRFRRSFICHYVGAQATDFEPPPGYHMSHLAIA